MRTTVYLLSRYIADLSQLQQMEKEIAEIVEMLVESGWHQEKTPR